MKEENFENIIKISNKEAISKFIEIMNIKARKIGMHNSHFTNVQGFYHDDHVSTPKDILLMMLQSTKYKELMEIMGRRSFECEIEGENPRKIKARTTIESSSVDNNYTILASKTGRIPRISTNLAAIADTKNENTSFLGVIFKGRTRYEGMRQLFDIGNTIIHSKTQIIPHEMMFKNGNFDFGNKFWKNNSGSFNLDYKDYYTYPASYIATSRGTSTQIHTGRLNFIPGHEYYVSCMVKCTRYNSGIIGFQFTATSKYKTVGLQRVSDGWEKVSGVFTADEGSSLRRVYFGGINKADLDGRIDNVTIIDMTKVYGKNKEPKKSVMDKYDYHDLSAEYGVVTKMPQTSVPYNSENLPILFEKNSEEQGYPASLTKVLTAMVFLDNHTDLNQKLILKESDLKGGSGTKFKAGDIMVLRDAFYTMMIESSNTIATAFARITGKKLIIEDKHLSK